MKMRYIFLIEKKNVQEVIDFFDEVENKNVYVQKLVVFY